MIRQRNVHYREKVISITITKKTRKPCCRKETARCRTCSFRFIVCIHYKNKSSHSFESQASELETYRRKTEFNAKWPFKVIQGHVFWSQWKGESDLLPSALCSFFLILALYKSTYRYLLTYLLFTIFTANTIMMHIKHIL